MATLSNNVFERCTSTGSEAFSLLTCLKNATNIALLRAFTLIETDLPENLGKPTAQECKKSTSGRRVSLYQ